MSDTSRPERPRWQRILLNWVLPIVGFLVLYPVVGWLRAPNLPDEAPDFTLLDLDGTPVTLSDLRGRPVIVNFWATWCGPCRMEIPSFSAFADDHPEIQVLGVVADGPPAKVRRVADDLGVTYPVLLGDPATLRAYGVSVFPTTVIVDAEGKVRSAHVGAMVRPQLWWATRGL